MKGLEPLPLVLGSSPYNDTEVVASYAIKEANKERTTLVRGDPVVLKEKTGETSIGLVEKATVANLGTNCLYGIIVSVPHVGYRVSVAIRGHVTCNLETSLFADIKVGACLKGKNVAVPCCSNITIVEKLKLLKLTEPSKSTTIDGFIIHIG